MDLPRSNDGEARFSVYVEGLTSVIGHGDRAKPLRDYGLGVMRPCERKSVEPIAAITAPKRTAAGHAERALQASWWQEHGAAHAGGPSAQQAGKLETRALFAGSQGRTVAPAGGNACGPPSARLDLRPPRGLPRAGGSGLLS